ncbi:hypothetical protein J6P59_06490 [bacterium]|nr:hypothetical protein [bacterium]
MILIDHHLLDNLLYSLQSIIDAIPNELVGIDDYDELIDDLNSAFLDFLVLQVNKSQKLN